jgi:DNA-binding transcriptional LysR family regulator
MFATVVELGSFKKAGERLGVPNSTISRRVMLLENQLGEKLLHRTTRKITLTDFGATVLSHARHVAEEVEATSALVDSRTSEPSGHLRISMPTDFTSDMLGSLFTRFLASYPKIALDIDVSRRRVDLIAENFDLAIRIGDLQDDATLAVRKVGLIEMGLYASPKYLHEHGVPDSPADLATHSILHLTQRIGEPMHLKLISKIEEWEGSLHARITANSPGILMNMALSGAGIAPLGDHLAAENVRSGLLVRVIHAWRQEHIPIWAIIPGRRLLPLRTQLFIEALKRELTLGTIARVETKTG